MFYQVIICKMLPDGDSCSTLTRFPNFMIAIINFPSNNSLSQFSTITTLIVVCIAIVLGCLKDVTEHYVSFHSLSYDLIGSKNAIGDKELSVLATGLKECQNLKELR